MRSQDPLVYAATWNGQFERTANGFDAGLERWLAYYRRREIGAIATGAVILHHRSGPTPNVWADDMPTRPSGPAGEQIRRAFAHQDRLARLTDPACLLDEVLAPLEGTRLDQTLRRRADGYRPAVARLRLEPGLGLSAPVPPAAWPVLMELDGQRPLRDLIASAVANTGFDAAAVSAHSLTTARRLVCLGRVDWCQNS